MAAGEAGEGAEILIAYSAGLNEAPRGLVVLDGKKAIRSVPPTYPGVVVVVCREPQSATAGVAEAADLALTESPDPPAPYVQVADTAVALAELERVVRSDRSASSASALVHVLRAGHRGSVEAGLVIESLAYSMLQSGPAFAAWRAEHPARPAEACRGDEVICERQDDLLRAVLNRPARHNAYNRCMRDLLLDVLAVAGADANLRVELSGRGPSFCSGGDLDEFGTFTDPVTAHGTRVGRSPARLLAALSDRVTARVHGACAGSGIELPAFAGQVLARPDSRFWLPELAMGLIPGAGGTVSLTRRIGRQRTAWLGLTGRPIDVPTALAWGLIDGVDDGD